MYLDDEIEKPALSAAVITYEDCDSRRVHLADTLTYTHTHSHTLTHTKYVYKRRVVAEKKRQAGRQTNRLMASVRKQPTTRNWKNRSQKNKTKKKAWENKNKTSFGFFF